MSKVLHLTLKKKWFDMIASGEKPEEYREIKDYWVVRLLQLHEDLRIDEAGNKIGTISGAFAYAIGYKRNRPEAVRFLLNNCAEFKPFDIVRFKNGYAKDAPTIDFSLLGITIESGREEWGAHPGREYFVIKLKNRIHRI